MKKAIKYLVTLVYKPLLSKYLSVTRAYSYQGVHLVIPPEVFHPGFFFSTKILLRYISRLPLQKATLLELGAGNGLIALYASKKGALVTATDINPVAIEYLRINRDRNDTELTILQSDLFNDIPTQSFDIVAINPPYYRKTAISHADHAWYCGENGEYFERLFKDLRAYLHAGSQVLMILSDACDMEMIRSHARNNGWLLNGIVTRKNWMEELCIFKIEPLQ